MTTRVDCCDRCGSTHPSVSVFSSELLCGRCFFSSEKRADSRENRENLSPLVNPGASGPPLVSLDAAVNPGPGPSPSKPEKGRNARISGIDGKSEAAELRGTDALIADYLAGRIQPEMVCLPNVPDDAPPLVREVVEDFEWVYGLRLATGRTDAVIYATRWAGQRLSVSHTSISNALGYLVEHKALSDEGNMPARGKGREGSGLYLPGQPVALPEPAGTVETGVGALHVKGAQPKPEAEDLSAVPAAVFGEDGVARDPTGRLSAPVGGTRLRDSGFHGQILPPDDDDDDELDEELDEYELDQIDRYERGEFS